MYKFICELVPFGFGINRRLHIIMFFLVDLVVGQCYCTFIVFSLFFRWRIL